MKATIILPTTGDRGPILEYSVGSVLKQSETDWELFIVGDGLVESSAVIAKEIAEKDSRIRFFEFEKDSSRGELNRHKLLSDEAEGEIVCYLCDRDLYLSNHISVMYDLLKKHDIGHSLPVIVAQNGTLRLLRKALDHSRKGHRREILRRGKNLPLTLLAHRMDAYKKLPHGWRKTPPGRFTDAYMCEQFLEQEWVRAGVAYMPTTVYIPRGGHPGLPTEKRLEESRFYFEEYCEDPNGITKYLSDFNKALFVTSSNNLLRPSAKKKKWYHFFQAE